MVYNDPKVVFTFSDGSAIVAQNVIKDSIKVSKKILSGLDSSSDTASLVLAPMAVYDASGNITLNGRILTSNSDVKAEIFNGSTIIYTGYVSNNRTWTLSKIGVDNLTVNLESVGTRKLKVPCTKNNMVYKGTVSEVVGYIIDKAGIEASASAPSITKEVYVRMAPTVDCDTLLNDILKEYGYYYFFENDGKLNYAQYNLNADSDAEKVLWASEDDERYESSDGVLRADGNTAVTIRRKIGDYKQAQVCYPTVSSRDGVLVYALDGSLTVPANSWWDGDFHSAITTIPSISFSQATLSKYKEDGYTKSYRITNWNANVGMVKLFIEVQFSADSIFSSSYSVVPTVNVEMMSGTTFVCQAWVSGGKTSSLFSSTIERTCSMVIHSGVVPDSIVLKNESKYVKAKIKQLYFSKATTSSDALASTTSASDLELGKEIWYMDNVYPYGFDSSSTVYVKQNDDSTGDTILDVLVDNSTGDSSLTIAKFCAKADIVTTDQDENYVYASKDGTLENPSYDTTYKYQTKYITEAESATSLANNLAKYYTYCQNQYYFSSYEDIPMGAVVRVVDNLYSRLDAKLCVTTKGFTIRKGRETIYSYSGYAVSDIRDARINSTINRSPSPVFKTEETLVFRLYASASTYIKDLRNSGNNDGITVTCDVSGYAGTPTVTCSVPSYYNATTGILTIPKNTTHDSITVTATLEGATSRTIVINAVDVTVYGKYLGKTTGGITDVEGDVYFDTSSKKLKIKKNGSWVDLNSSGIRASEISEFCMAAQKDVLSTIPVGSVASSDYGYFNSIIAGTVTADYIGARDITLQGSGAIKSSNYVPGTSGFNLGSDGNADITGAVHATSFKIGDTTMVFQPISGSKPSNYDAFDISTWPELVNLKDGDWKYVLFSVTMSDSNGSKFSSLTGGFSVDASNVSDQLELQSHTTKENSYTVGSETVSYLNIPESFRKICLWWLSLGSTTKYNGLTWKGYCLKFK